MEKSSLTRPIKADSEPEPVLEREEERGRKRKREKERGDEVGHSQKLSLRKLLDTPFRERPFWYLAQFPVWATISFLFSRVAALRRRFMAPKAASAPPDCQVVCVGNLVLGGSGKSPLVRHLLQTWLQRGKRCGLLSRGYGSHWTESDVENALRPKETNLAEGNPPDEVMETLRWLGGLGSNLAVGLGPNRVQSASRVAQKLGAPCTILMDDGLQNFGLAQHRKICVWPFPLVQTAPPYSVPLGPYREGFGKRELGQLADQMDLNIWSRVLLSEEEFESPQVSAGFQIFSKAVRQHLSDWSWSQHSHALAVGKLRPWEGRFPSASQLNTSLEQQKLAIVIGVANPQAALKSFLDFCRIDATSSTSVRVILLADHGQLSQGELEILSGCNLILTTLKDFERFSALPLFQEKKDCCFVLGLTVKIVGFQGETLSFVSDPK